MPASLPRSRRAAAARRRVAGHICTGCHRPWALRATVETELHAGRRVAEWVVRCRYCDYRRPVLVIPDDALAPAAN